jgi:hypothetical protein
MACENLGQGAFSRAVGAHHGMNVTCVNGEVDSLQYFLLANTGVEISNF